MERALQLILSASLRIHNRIYDDTHESLCSRAWRLQGSSRFWRAWVRVFGPDHCQKSYRHYHE